MPPLKGLEPDDSTPYLRRWFRVLVTQCHFENSSKQITLRINLGTGKFAEARIYCAGVAGVLVREGSVGIHLGGAVRAGIRTRRKCMKRIGFLTVLIMAMFLIALTFAAAAAGPKSSAAVPVASAPASPAAPVAAPAPPPHPRVHEAIEAMRSARERLAHAEGEFHGHREKALEHLDRAIHEAEDCEHMP
jgi:hypothetical protein